MEGDEIAEAEAIAGGGRREVVGGRWSAVGGLGRVLAVWWGGGDNQTLGFGFWTDQSFQNVLTGLNMYGVGFIFLRLI